VAIKIEEEKKKPTKNWKKQFETKNCNCWINEKEEEEEEEGMCGYSILFIFLLIYNNSANKKKFY